MLADIVGSIDYKLRSQVMKQINPSSLDVSKGESNNKSTCRTKWYCCLTNIIDDIDYWG